MPRLDKFCRFKVQLYKLWVSFFVFFFMPLQNSSHTIIKPAFYPHPGLTTLDFNLAFILFVFSYGLELNFAGVLSPWCVRNKFLFCFVFFPPGQSDEFEIFLQIWGFCRVAALVFFSFFFSFGQRRHRLVLCFVLFCFFAMKNKAATLCQLLSQRTKPSSG